MRLCSIVLAISLLFSARAQGSLGQGLELRLEGKPRAVANQTLKVGHAAWRFGVGNADRILSGTKTVGFFFSGEATFNYVSEFPMEYPVFRRNLERNATPVSRDPKLLNLEGKRMGFGAPVSEVLLVGNFADLFQDGPEGKSLDAVFKEHQAFFSRTKDPGGRLDEEHPLMHELQYGSLNALEGVFALAQMVSPRKGRLGSDNLIFRFDERWQRLETLNAVDTFRAGGEVYFRTSPLSWQPIGWSLKNPPLPHVVLTHVDLDLVQVKDRNATLRVKETLVPTRPLRGIVLDLLNVVRRGMGGGFSTDGYAEGHFRLTSVKDHEGKALGFSHQRGEVLIDLGRQMPADQPVALEFSIEGDFLIGPYGYSYWELGTMPWFPQPTRFEAQFYTVKAEVSVPKPHVPVVGGTRMVRSESSTHNKVVVEIDKPVQFFTAFGGNYNLQQFTREGQTIHIATYGLIGGNEKKLAEMALGLIEYYESFLGPFPFRDYQFVQVPAFGYGQAPPGLMILSQEAFNNKMDDMSKFFVGGANHRIAHEIAHQYWAHVVKMPSLEEQWITEAFAEYTSAMAMRRVKNQGDNAFNALLAGWKRHAKEYSEVAPIPLANRIASSDDPRGAFLARTALLYSKGPFLLHHLRQEVGDSTFARFLAQIQQRFAWRSATTEELRQLLEELSGKNLQPFFDQFYWSTQLPKD